MTGVTRIRPDRRVLGLLANFVLAGGLGGCYERVVSSSGGFGSGPDTVYESNLESSRVPVIDDLLDQATGAPPRQDNTGTTWR